MPHPPASYAAALADACARLPRDLPVAASGDVAARLEADGHAVVRDAFVDLAPASVCAALAVDGEISTEGDRADEIVSRATDALRPGGRLVLTAFSEPDGAGVPAEPRGVAAARASPSPRTQRRAYSLRELETLLLHRGLAIERLERHGDRLLAVATAPVSSQERSARFIASLPFKLVTAAVLCRDRKGRILCVFDTFRHHWTIPGGVVDAGEDPRAGAVREAVEEGGVAVTAGELLGVFSTAVPDRLLLLYAASPTHPDADAVLNPLTRQPHEIGDVAWLDPDTALERLNPRARWQVEQCLRAPGETWRE